MKEMKRKMNELLKVSIIISVHNSERTLDRCLSSICNQNYKNIECILIENGSIDNSKSICSSYASQNANIIYNSIKKSGVSMARNVGLEKSTGDIVGFCDADDFIEENAISAVVAEFVKFPNVVAVYGGFNVGTIENGSVKRKYRGLKREKISTIKALQLNIVNDSVMGSVWNKYYRKNILENIKFDEELDFCEDMHFNANVLSSISLNYGVQVIVTPLYCYMDNLISITHDETKLFDSYDELKYIVALKRIRSDFKIDEKSKELVNMKIACFAIDTLSNVEISWIQKEKLVSNLKENYIYLVKNVFINNWKWNIKRILKGLYYIRYFKKSDY